MRFLQSFKMFEKSDIKNSDEILTIGDKTIDITKLTKNQQQDIYDLISKFDTQMTEDELIDTIELYIKSLS